MLEKLEKKYFLNKKIDKKVLGTLTAEFLTRFGLFRTVNLLESFKNLGFRYATNGGISLGIEDLKIPVDKKYLLLSAEKEIHHATIGWQIGIFSDIERFQAIIDIWNNTSESLKNRITEFFHITDPLNNIYMIAFSGARGNLSQVRQLIGMRGLMANQKGQIIDLPITKNFREGLSSVDYIISSYGARKGIVDTALRTADSGYLTRRLVEIGQDVIIREIDCFTSKGLLFQPEKFKNLESSIIGRVLAQDIVLESGIKLYRNTLLDSRNIRIISNSNISTISIRSPLTCESYHSICQQCYGWNLAYQKKVHLGEAIGVIAGQSIGEPGTQMTMRTFHTGGVFSGQSNKKIFAKISGTIRYTTDGFGILVRNMHGKMVFQVQSELVVRIFDWKNSYQEFLFPPGCILNKKEGDYVTTGMEIGEILPNTSDQNALGLKQFKALLSPEDSEIVFGGIKIRHKGPVIEKTDSLLFFNQKNGVIWLLSGWNMTLPKNAEIIINNSRVSKDRTLGRFFVTFEYACLSNYCLSNKFFKFEYIPITLFSSLNLVNLKKKKGRKFANQGYFLSKLGSDYFIVTFNPMNAYEHLVFRTKLRFSNSIFFRNLKQTRKTIKNRRRQPHTNKKDKSFFFLDNCFLLFSQKLYLSNSLIKNYLNGFGLIIQNKPIVFRVSLKDNDLYHRLAITSRLVFAGEILFDRIRIKTLSYLQLVHYRHEKALFFCYPIFEKQVNQVVPNISNYLTFNSEVHLTHFYAPKFLQYHGKQILLRKLTFILTYKSFKLFVNRHLESDHLHKLQYYWKQNKFKVGALRFLDVINMVARATATKGVTRQLIPLTHDYQGSDSFIRHFSLNLFPVEDFRIHSIRRLISDKQIFNFVRSTDVVITYLENLSSVSKKYPFQYSQIHKQFYLEQPAFFYKFEKNKAYFRKAIPVFLTTGALVRHLNHHIINRGDNFAILVNYKKQTDDIIQGLPKIEELIELRGRYNYAYLLEKAGVILNIQKKLDYNLYISSIDNKNWRKAKICQKIQDDPNKLLDWWSGQATKKKYSIPLACKKVFDCTNPVFCEKLKWKKEDKYIEAVFSCNLKSLAFNNASIGSFAYLGIPLSKGPISPRELARVFFNKFSRKRGQIIGLDICIHKIQQVLVQSIQTVYKSQGIYISDKHIEVLVKQMTSKVEIKASGDTPLLKGDIIDLEMIKDLSRSLIKNNYYPPNYKPYLCGVTKATLKGEGFLSAASFQETRKILSESAIEGKCDWLRSIKANVITGRLIPAGTGFNQYQWDFVNSELVDLVQFFNSRSKKSNKRIKNNY